MAATFVLHRVSDYDAWRKIYDSVGDMQKAGGVVEENVWRSAEDPNVVLVYHRFGSMDEARAFFGNEDLRAAMGEGGVDLSSLRLEFYEEA